MSHIDILENLYTLSIFRLSLLCSTEGRGDLLQTHKTIIPLVVIPESVQGMEFVLQQQIRNQQSLGEVVRYERMLQLCKLSPCALYALDCAVAIAYQPRLSTIVQALCGEHLCTMELAQRLYEAVYPNQAEQSLEQQKRDFLRLCKLLVTSEDTSKLFLYQPLVADDRLLEYLSGSDNIQSMLEGIASLQFAEQPLPPVLIRQKEINHLVDAIQYGEQGPARVQIQGGEHIGKRFLVSHACKEYGHDMLYLDASVLLPMKQVKQKEILYFLLRECLFYEMGICVTDVTELLCPDEYQVAFFWKHVMEPIWRLSYPICICTDESISLISLASRELYLFTLPEYNRSERIALWQGFCEQERLQTEIDCMQMGSKYKLNGAEISKIVHRIHMQEIISQNTLDQHQIAALKGKNNSHK